MPYRLGAIGVGGNSAGHLRRFLAMPEVEVVGMADPSDASIATARSNVEGLDKVPAYADWRHLLDATDLDLALVSTPHTLHHEHVMGALDAGLHVLCEKPLAHTPELAQEIADHAQAVERHVVVGFQRRFSPGYTYMRQRLQSRDIGDITHVQASQWQAWIGAARGKWRSTVALGGGGQLSDSGSHLMDMLLWTTGLRIVEVDARLRTYDLEVEADGAAVLVFDNGAIGTLSIIGTGHTFGERLAVVAGSGAIRADWASGGVEVIFEDDLEAKVTREVEGLTGGSNPDEHFLEVLNGTTENGSPPEDSVHLLEVLAAIRRSAVSGQREVVRQT
ncbi:MAG: Gfo/Idh/MocA family oxidoreductase [Chloroflexota bacterium]|nr:Gfo/Idh/MocA family oxidoreductase [Chloroflexota bacterium]